MNNQPEEQNFDNEENTGQETPGAVQDQDFNQPDTSGNLDDEESALDPAELEEDDILEDDDSLEDDELLEGDNAIDEEEDEFGSLEKQQEGSDADYDRGDQGQQNQGNALDDELNADQNLGGV